MVAQTLGDAPKWVTKAKALYASRQEYKDFPLKTFSKHIHQELAKAGKQEFRFLKKQKKQGKQARNHA